MTLMTRLNESDVLLCFYVFFIACLSCRSLNIFLLELDDWMNAVVPIFGETIVSLSSCVVVELENDFKNENKQKEKKSI